MKILIVASLYYPSVGGIENYLKETAKRLVQKGHAVHVFTAAAASWRATRNPFAKESDILEEVIDGVKIKRFKSRRWLSFCVGFLAFLFWSAKLIFNDYLRTLQNGPILIGLNKEINNLKPDLIFASSFPAYSILQAHKAAQKAAIPFVLLPAMHPSDRWAFERKVFYKILLNSGCVLANTEFEKKYLVKKGVAPDKIKVLGCGINLHEFSQAKPRFREKYAIPSDHILLLFIGHKTAQKGVNVLIRAMPEIWKINPGISLILAGSPDPFFTKLKKQTQKFYPAGKIIDIDSFKSQDKADLIASCDIFVLPSTAESFGIVYLEAWACKKPVIGCRGGAPESIIDHGQNGFLIKPEDKKDLAAAVLRLAKDKKLREKMGQNGYNKVERLYTWDAIAPKLETVLKECLKHP